TDTILRRGRYIAYRGGLPLTPGYDVVGTVDAVDPGVRGLNVGQRVADMTVSGGYSQYLIRPAGMLIPVPPGIEPAIAVELPLMGMTAWQMLTRCVSLQPGAPILVVGASGSVGRALVALGRHLGLKVIGTSSDANLSQVAALGATALDYRRPDLLAAIRDASGADGVAAAFDAVGGRSWKTSFQSLGRNGTLVAYGFQDFLDGNKATHEAMVGLFRLHKVYNRFGQLDGSGRRSIFYDIDIRRQAEPEDYRADMETLLDLVAGGAYRPPQPEIIPLTAAAEAHRRIARRGLDHRLVLDPWL
ncbi:MAG TPA: zinc-binding dehydrogenase, partial [Sphingobium sp.]